MFGKNIRRIGIPVEAPLTNEDLREELDIPKEAFDYIIGGKSLIEWIIDRYQNKTDKN